MQIKFYDKMEDSHLKFAVIIAKMDGKYVFCKHRERSRFRAGIEKMANLYWMPQSVSFMRRPVR